MAVPEQTPYKEYVGNGVTTNFALGFACDLKQELKVFINNIEPELSTWSLVSGSVVFTTAPSSGSKIVLKRATKLERTTNYSSVNNSFQPEAINKDFDRVWYAIQDQNYKVGQYDFDYSYAINTSNQALSDAATAQQRADDAYDLADTTNTEIRDIERGGTGADNAADARTNLELYSQSEVDALIATGGQGSIVGVSGGGTGATTAEQARENLSVYSKSETNTAITEATPAASETEAGVVRLTNNLTSTDTDKALTAAQGKVLRDRQFATVGYMYLAGGELNVAFLYSSDSPMILTVTATIATAGTTLQIQDDVGKVLGWSNSTVAGGKVFVCAVIRPYQYFKLVPVGLGTVTINTQAQVW